MYVIGGGDKMYEYERKQLFNEELSAMKQSNFIDDATYERVSDGSNLYYENIIEEFNVHQETIRTVNMVKEQSVMIDGKQDKAERKASILLNLGVLFLFLSGLIFATTNWSTLELLGKVMAVMFMGGILSAGSYIADTKMSLKKMSSTNWSGI